MNTARRPTSWLAWGAALAVASALLAASGFVSRDPDSRVYSEIGALMSERPIGTWLAPEWWGVAGADEPFREHPFGIFVAPALLARTGFPAEQAGYAVGALYSILAVVLAGLLAAEVVGERDAVAVQWALLLLPVSFVYRIRANQEYPVLVLLVLAVYATERVRRDRAWFVVPALAMLGILFVKGVFAVFCPIACALWLLVVRDPEGDDRRAWAAIGLSLAAAAAGTAVYELAYRRLTGESFLAFYLRFRVGPNSGLSGDVGAGFFLYRLTNVGWYLARLAWFGAPGSLVLLAGLRQRRPWASSRRTRGLAFCLAFAAMYVAAMSLGNNRADRFVFPAYFAVGAAGAGLAVGLWRRPARWAARVASLGQPGVALLWLSLFLLTLASSQELPRMKFWP